MVRPPAAVAEQEVDDILLLVGVVLVLAAARLAVEVVAGTVAVVVKDWAKGILVKALRATKAQQVIF